MLKLFEVLVIITCRRAFIIHKNILCFLFDGMIYSYFTMLTPCQPYGPFPFKVQRPRHTAYTLTLSIVYMCHKYVIFATAVTEVKKGNVPLIPLNILNKQMHLCWEHCKQLGSGLEGWSYQTYLGGLTAEPEHIFVFQFWKLRILHLEHSIRSFFFIIISNCVVVFF